MGGLLRNPSGRTKSTAPHAQGSKSLSSGTNHHMPIASPVTNNAKGQLGSFVRKASIPSFIPGIIPNIEKGMGCNDDLTLSSFRSSEFTWAGAQRRGLSPEITDAATYAEHMGSASKAPSPINTPGPPPPASGGVRFLRMDQIIRPKSNY